VKDGRPPKNVRVRTKEKKPPPKIMGGVERKRNEISLYSGGGGRGRGDWGAKPGLGKGLVRQKKKELKKQLDFRKGKEKGQ